MKGRVRQIVELHTDIDIEGCGDGGDLWQAGMQSKQAVRVMLAAEDEFGIEFPPEGLGAETFSSVDSIAEIVEELAGERAGT